MSVPPSRVQAVNLGILKTLKSAIAITKTVMVITIPVVILVRFLELHGMIDMLAGVLEPIMGIVYLPGESALIWAVTMVSSLYAGLVVFVTLGQDFTVLQSTVMVSLMLGAHGILVEMVFVAKTGCRFVLFTALRLGMTVLSVYIMANIMMAFSIGTEQTTIHFIPTMPINLSWADWAVVTAQQLAIVPIIAFVMVGFLNILRAIGIADRLSALLAPLLTPIGIRGADSGQITMVGTLLGLTLGGALVVEETKQGTIPDRDIAMIMLFLCNMHAMLEDNALMTLMGAWVMGFVVLRAFICYGLLVIMGWVFYALSDRVFYKYVFRQPPQIAV